MAVIIIVSEKKPKLFPLIKHRCFGLSKSNTFGINALVGLALVSYQKYGWLKMSE